MKGRSSQRFATVWVGRRNGRRKSFNPVWWGILFFLFILPSVTTKALAPKILQKIQGAEPTALARGTRFQLFCTATEGDLPLTFRWMKNGQSMSSSTDIVVRRIDDYSSNLFIESVTEYHSGNYSCVASNAAGMDSYTVSLQVNVPPYWIHQPIDGSSVFGGDIQIPCEAGGHPKPKVTWKKSNDMLSHTIQDVSDSGRFKATAEGSLTISRSQKDDSGYYTCEISNGVGPGLRKTAKVDVYVPPQMGERFRLLTERKGHSVHLTCEVIGDLPLKIEWRKGDRLLNPISEIKLSAVEKENSSGVSSILEISDVEAEDSGIYRCMAENSRGRGETQNRLVIVEPPGKISKVTMLNVWSRSIRLSWIIAYNGNSPIMNILIELKSTFDDPGDKMQRTVKPNEPSSVLEELSPGTTYYLWVRAENEVGIGEPSDRLMFTTMEEEPSHPPANFKVDSVRARSARFSWEAMKPGYWNGKSLGYYLGYVESRSKGPYAYRGIWNRQLPNETLKTYLLSGLHRATDYTVVIRAFNSAGLGPLSDPVKIRTKTGVPPNTPTIKILSSKSNDVEFNIYQESQDDEVESYVCHIKRLPKTWEEAPLVVNSRGRYTIGGLVGDSKYQAFVTAKNAFGASEPSEVVSFNTIPADPFAFGKVESDPLLDRTWTFVLPTALSLFIILVSFVLCCCVLCDCFNQKKTPRKQDGVVVRDFSYCAPASCSRSESNYNPPLRASLPRGSLGSQSGLMSTNRSAYNEPRNYSPSTEDSEEPKYECVMEEMKTFLQPMPQNKTGSGSSNRSSKQGPVHT